MSGHEVPFEDGEEEPSPEKPVTKVKKLEIFSNLFTIITPIIII